MVDPYDLKYVRATGSGESKPKNGLVRVTDGGGRNFTAYFDANSMTLYTQPVTAELAKNVLGWRWEGDGR